MKKLTPVVRKRLYEIGIAAIAAAVIYGLFTGDQAEAWMTLLAALLGVARVNVNDDSDSGA